MWLLNAETKVLEEFTNEIPPYAILSHRWASDPAMEVSFREIREQTYPNDQEKFSKIEHACDQALRDGLYYIWVDTCCINKESSAELSEAINSMFRWYEYAVVCYAYLCDVPDGVDISSRHSAFRKSTWFRRGWTLQELLAPTELCFFSTNWHSLGTKNQLQELLSEITLIDKKFLLKEEPLSRASFAKRMSWASRRQTTRTEDLAYCLLGVFGIHMALLYGEGGNAFIRLQEEIMKNSDDQSLFAWGYTDSKHKTSDGYYRSKLLADEPAAFQSSGNLVPDELDESSDAYHMTNKGLRITLPVLGKLGKCRAVLACRHENRFHSLVTVPIYQYGEGVCVRVGVGELPYIPREEAASLARRTLCFIPALSHEPPWTLPSYTAFYLVIRNIPIAYGIQNLLVEPKSSWYKEERLIQLLSTCHAVIRLPKQNGYGTAIVIPNKDKVQERHQPVVLKDPGTNLAYDFLGKNAFGYQKGKSMLERCDRVKATLGTSNKYMSSGHIVRTLDIEFLEGKGDRGSQKSRSTKERAARHTPHSGTLVSVESPNRLEI